jgi:uncharacterized protein (DUF2237 family)
MPAPLHEKTNALGEPIAPCSSRPKTGFFRDGCCNTSDDDAGSHTVCVRVTDAFLAFSKSRGNDLSTPRPDLGFAGLGAGDQWCVCAARWQEAFLAGAAPHVVLASTHKRALEVCSLQDLMAHALDVV